MKLSHRETLQQAQQAAQQKDWSIVSEGLQQLLLSEERLEPIASQVETDLPNQLLDLALQVLKGGDFQDRWDVAKVFPALGERSIAPLITLLESDADSEAQWFAVRILGGFAHPDVLAAIVRLLKTSDQEELRGMAVTVLVNAGDEAIAILQESLQSETTRLVAAQALAQIRRPATIPLLLEVVNDSDPQIRATAIESLGSFHQSEISAALIRATQDPIATVRRAAVIALGFCAAEATELDLVSHLRPLLLDLNLDVCKQTAIALGRLGTLEATTALFQSLESIHTPEPLAIELIRALGWVGRSEALQDLHRALTQLPLTESLRQEVLVVLGRVEPPNLKPQATQILLDLLTHEAVARSPAARQAIALGLGQLGDLNALNPLIDLLADSNVSVRLHVVSALKTLAPETAYQRLEQLSQSERDSELGRGVAIALQEWRQ
ncbi:HEAT repeat domain-containing protein [Phormidesmis priestleyi]